MATSLYYNNSNGECALGFKFDCSDRVFGYLYDGKRIVLADEQEFSKKYYDYIKPVKSPDDMETFFRTTGCIGFAEELLLSRCDRHRVEGCGQTHGQEDDEIRHFFNDSILYVLTKTLINAKPKEEKNDGICFVKTEKPRGEGRVFTPTCSFVPVGDRTDGRPKGTRRIVRYIGKDEGNIVNGHFYLLVEKADDEHSIIIVPPENKPVTVSDQCLEFSDRPKRKEPETKKPKATKARKDDSVVKMVEDELFDSASKLVEDELFDTMGGIVEKKKTKKRATFNYDYWDGYINF